MTNAPERTAMIGFPSYLTEDEKLSSKLYYDFDSVSGDLEWYADPENVGITTYMRFFSKNRSNGLSDERFLSHAEADAKTDLEKELVARLDGTLSKLYETRKLGEKLKEMFDAFHKLDSRLEAENNRLIDRIGELESELEAAKAKANGHDHPARRAYHRVNATRMVVGDLVRWAIERGRKTVPLDALEKAYRAGAEPR